MKVKDVIARLQTVNPEAEFQVIALNRAQPFTWSHGSSDGCTEANCDTFGPYLDHLNEAEARGGTVNDVLTVFGYAIAGASLSAVATLVIAIPMTLAWCAFVNWADRKGLL